MGISNRKIRVLRFSGEAMTDLVQRNQYGANYIPDIEEFKRSVHFKTAIPHQVEFQPGPLKGNLCWLKCPYCYGGSATDTGERLSKKCAIETLNEIADGGVNKVIFAGYCTDPLNCEYIEDLLEVAIERQMIFGFNTKAIRVSDGFLKLLSSPNIVPGSYISISVDAGNNESYNRVHGVSGNRIYSRVKKNVEHMAMSRAVNIDITATYLINKLNNNKGEVEQFISDFRNRGCDLIRFAFPQQPRGSSHCDPNESVPVRQGSVWASSQKERERYKERLLPLIHEEDINGSCRVMLVDADTEHGIFRKRTLPCVARWVYPTIGFDGWVYPCSQSAAPNFRKIALGNLAEKNFWDILDDYDVNNLYALDMDEAGCRCDRKEHIVNAKNL